MRTRVAILMAVIATFGAVVAYRAVTAEEDTSTWESRLKQGQVLELNRRAELLNKYRELAQFQESEDLARLKGDYLRHKAEELRKEGLSGSSELDIQAEEQFEIARIYKRVGDFNYVYIARGDSVETGIEKIIAADLSTLGYGAGWAEPKKDGIPFIWGGLQSQVDINRKKSVCLSGLVVLFVLALAFLTFTQISADGSRLQRWLERIAYIIVVGASIACFVIDYSAWWLFLVAGVGIGFVAFVGNKLYNRPEISRWLTEPRATVDCSEPPPSAESPIEGEKREPSHPHELGPRVPFVGAHLLALECTSTMERFALSLIAITVLLAAVCGWRYDRATAFADDAASRAIEQQVIAFKHLSRRQVEIHYIWGVEAAMHESRIRIKAALQRADLARQGLFGLTEPAQLSEVEWQKELLARNRRFVEQLDEEWGPDQDAYYPEKELETAARKDPEAAFAEWDAENELRQAWHSKASNYLLTLTMFAIALYLLGQSMGMGLTRGAFILVLGGSLIAGVGALCGLKAAVKSLPHTAPAASDAAEHYGAGRLLYTMAHEAADYQKAADEFKLAIKARPSFALAHYYFAESLYNAGRIHPDESDTLPSRKSGTPLPKTVDEMKTSLDEFSKQGITPPEELVGRYGFYTFLQGLSSRNRKVLNQGITVLKRGLVSYPKDTWLELNLAVSLLEGGKIDEAHTYYDESFKQGVGARMAIAAIGDLEIARQYCGVFRHADCATLDSEITRLKSRLVVIAGPKPEGADWTNSRPSMSTPELYVSPAFVRWTSPSIKAKQGRDVLVVIWYHKDDDWGAWRVVSSVSGVKNLDDLESAGAEGKSLTLSYLAKTEGHRCLDKGDYRAEFYLNGKLVAERSTSLSMATDFKGIGLYDINMEACYPASWSDWRFKSPDLTGPDLARGSMSPDKKRGVYLFSYFYPHDKNQESALIEQAIARSQKILESHGLPSNLIFQSKPESCTSYPVDRSANAMWYQDSTRVATARAWVAGDGIVYVGMAVNGARNGLDADDCMLLTSLSNIYAPYKPLTTTTSNAAKSQ